MIVAHEVSRKKSSLFPPNIRSQMDYGMKRSPEYWKSPLGLFERYFSGFSLRSN